MQTKTPPEQPRRKSLREKLCDWPQHPELMLYVMVPLMALFFVVIIVMPWQKTEVTPHRSPRCRSCGTRQGLAASARL